MEYSGPGKSMIQFVLFTKQLGTMNLKSLLYGTVCVLCKAIGHSGPEKSTL